MKRLKRILKWTGIVLGGLAAILLVANAILVWTTGTRLERQLAAIREAGDPLVLTDLARPPIPPEKNAATYLRRAEAGVAAIHNEVGSDDFWEYFQTRDPMPAEIQKAVKAAFSAHPDVIPLLQQAAACPDYDPQLDYTVSPGEFIASELSPIQALRMDGRVLEFRVRLLVAEANYDEALRTALILFRLSRHCARNPTLVEYLVAIALQGMAIDSASLALQAGPVSKGVREALDAELAVQERSAMEEYIRALQGDRVLYIDLFGQSAYREEGSGSPFGNCWLIGRWVWNRRESQYLDEMQSFLALLREPVPYRQADAIFGITDYFSSLLAAWSEWAEWAETADEEDVVRDGVRDSERTMQHPFLMVAQTLQAVTSLRARIRSLRVLNALQTHVPAGSGEVPKLTELGLPAETIIDPFTEEPLCVKKTPHGWLVYSVGPNYRDDGGKLEGGPNSDIGVGPPPAKNRDP
jgi:hypothetical protein